MLFRPFPHGDDVAFVYLVGRDIHQFAVHAYRLVGHKLSRLGARRAEAHAVNHIVEPAFEQLQQILAGRALAPGRFLVIAAKLFLENAVGAAHFLLLAQLHAIVRQPPPALSVLTGNDLGLAFAVDGTNAAFQKQVGAFPAGQLAFGAQISGHVQSLLWLFTKIPLRATRVASSAGGNRCEEWESRR